MILLTFNPWISCWGFFRCWSWWQVFMNVNPNCIMTLSSWCFAFRLLMCHTTYGPKRRIWRKSDWEACHSLSLLFSTKKGSEFRNGLLTRSLSPPLRCISRSIVHWMDAEITDPFTLNRGSGSPGVKVFVCMCVTLCVHLCVCLPVIEKKKGEASSLL